MTSSAVLVTGCSSGIGRATALTLARAGLPTWATARRPETIEDLAGAGCRILPLDVTDEDSCAQAVEAVEKEHGAVGALVNNAGYTQVGAVEELTLEQYRRQFETNVLGGIRLTQLVLPGMRAQRSGTVVYLGSGAGLVAPPASSAYAMTKFALEALSDALRLEVTGFGVRVVLLEPGAVRTRLMDTGWDLQARTDSGSPYATFMANVRAMTDRAHRPEARNVLDAQAVADVIVRAITSRRPRTRYPIGSGTRLAPLLRRLLGDRGWDRLMGRLVPFSG
ncbi:SDR family oxidoreductase [Nonomuraea rubra]|uniref:NAD(P)-dependent dehydrogenase (Short-subunit alcohol dehydrogenase family) n=1 Tax=Nonomuraea rubra TaxID=46180 RepID=A0A7X0NTK4_9ACTN|nr:SDR family oxidoreductase [Nonomuraea rubra]MBB6549295.1 NAD(P)-dependent dehydrogenase (short-subunit alcohol dehydrogenase family) [Nonomuraea rubra]